MLVLSRKLGEQLVIDENIVVQVLAISGNRVQLGIQAPIESRVLRKELALQEAPARASARIPLPDDIAGPGPPPSDEDSDGEAPGEPTLEERSRRAGTSHLVVAEDDDEMRALLTQSLRAEGYEVTECRDGMQLVGLLWDGTEGHMRRDFDLVVSDIRMPGVLGLSVLAGVQACGGGPPVIMITAFGDEATHAEALRLGAACILDKPFEVDELLVTVRTVLHG